MTTLTSPRFQVSAAGFIIDTMSSRRVAKISHPGCRDKVGQRICEELEVHPENESSILDTESRYVSRETATSVDVHFVREQIEDEEAHIPPYVGVYECGAEGDGWDLLAVLQSGLIAGPDCPELAFPDNAAVMGELPLPSTFSGVKQAVSRMFPHVADGEFLLVWAALPNFPSVYNYSL